MYAVDLHCHTRFFHSRPGEPTPFDPVSARLLARYARKRGLDAVALTNHDYYEPFFLGGVLAIPGIEISTTRGHLLVVGPDPPTRTRPGELSPEDAVALAHDRGCVAVIPHPFRHSTVRRSDAPFDAVECNGKHPETHGRARALADRLGCPTVGGSDAHFPFEVGRGYTEVDADELTPESVVAAVRDGRVREVVDDGRGARTMRRLYDVVHRIRGHR